MANANEKGAFHVTLQVEKNGSSESLCVLQKPLLKKTGNWALMVTDLFLNKTPALNRQMGEQFRIVPFKHNAMGAGFRPEDYIFTPIESFTIMEYTVQLQRFFHKFSFLFMKYGITGMEMNEELLPLDERNFVAAEDIATKPIHYTKENYVQTGQYLENEGYSELDTICSCQLDGNLRVRIRLEPLFLANFFIDCQDHFCKRLGFPPHLFVAGPIVGTKLVSLFDYLTLLNPNGYPDFIPEVAQFQASDDVPGNYPDTFQVFESEFSIRELDDRVSLDLVSTFPASRKINVLDGTEQQEYVLARFHLSNLKEFESTTVQDSDEMSLQTTISETYDAGIENLTRGNSGFASNLLLPGTLQQIHLMLYTRYLEHGEIKRDKTDLEDGFWHARILFSKKI